MIASHEWVRAFVPHDLDAQALGALLSAHVATLDGLEPLRAELAPFVVGQVVHSEAIPDTRLSFNRVDDGSGQLLEIVCGAPNVVVGEKYPVARVGTAIPGKDNLVIERRKIRGFTSAGMLCSAMELGLGTDHDGILRLDTSAPPGTALLDVVAAGDVRLELDVLANRPDLLSQRGLAREVSALTGVPLGTPSELRESVPTPEAEWGMTEASADGVHVRVDDAAGCPRYCAAIIRGVRVGPSPQWLVDRLAAVGARSINNVVDATNYCLLGLGQPMHAFDLRALGDQVVVRSARDGETLTTLDGVERTLSDDALVIAGAARAEAVAGVIGGKGSEVTPATTDVLLEVAYFEPRRARASRIRAGVSTDASYRFERGVDRGATLELARLGASLVVSVAGGTVNGLIDVGSAPGALPPVMLRRARLAQVLGTAIEPAHVERLLRAIGFTIVPENDEMWSVAPPSWRHDVDRDVDLVEDIARLVGFDALPGDLRPFRPGSAPDDPLFVASERVRRTLVGAGLLEARPMPFVAGSDETHARVVNPLGEDEPHLRRAVLESLARRAEHNLARMQGDLRLFEIGNVFIPQARGSAGGAVETPPDAGAPPVTAIALPVERLHVGALVMGARRPPHFTEADPPPYDLWDAKALGELVGVAAFPGARVACAPVGEEELLWRILVDGVARGEVRALRLDLPPWASQPYGVELEIATYASAPVAAQGANAWGRSTSTTRPPDVQYRTLPTTPAVSFDLALLVPSAVSADHVARVIRAAAGELLERLELFDVFDGGAASTASALPGETRSLAWRLTLRDPQRTLRDKEIDGRRQRLLRALESELGVRQRSA